MNTEYESVHKVNSEEEDSPTASAGIWTRKLSITSPVLYQQAFQASEVLEDSGNKGDKTYGE